MLLWGGGGAIFSSMYPPYNFPFLGFGSFRSFTILSTPMGEKKKGDDDITFCQAPFCVFNELSKSPPPFLVHLCERGNARQERNK